MCQQRLVADADPKHWGITSLKRSLLGTRSAGGTCLADSEHSPTGISIRVNLPVSSAESIISIHHPLLRADANKLRRCGLCWLQDKSPGWPGPGGQSNRRHRTLGQTWSGLSCHEQGHAGGHRLLEVLHLHQATRAAGGEHRSIWSDPTAMSCNPGSSYGGHGPRASLGSGPGGSRVGEHSLISYCGVSGSSSLLKRLHPAPSLPGRGSWTGWRGGTV